MPVSAHTAADWSALVDGLAATLAADPPGPFDAPEVLVASRPTGRILRQQLAARLPTGICAGIAFPTLRGWIGDRAATHGLAEESAVWDSARAQLVAAEALGRLASGHHVLSAHLARDESPARLQELAARSVGLFRRYVAHAPAMVSAWLAGEDVDALGDPLADHLAWQPELCRRVAESLEVDPVETWRALAEAVGTSPRTLPLHVFALPEATPRDVGLLAAAGRAGPLVIWRVAQDDWPDWAAPLLAGGEPAPAEAPRRPRIEVHGSHGPARQVEVLRDELTRRFEADPALEPRDVVIVCDDPQRWAPHLRAAFDPVPDHRAHPGRSLRVQAGAQGGTNLAREVALRCLRMPEARVTSIELLDLLHLPPIARRWGFDRHREDLVELVAAAGIRWGLDAEHRADFGLGPITQNTWFRGVDRLLAGVALSPGGDSVLATTGVATVGTSDLDLVGGLAEVVSRLRRFRHVGAAPATAACWAARVQGLLGDLTAFDPAELWMPLEVSARLADLVEELGDDGPELSRAAFARFFADRTQAPPLRPSAGNGSLQVVGVGDLPFVGHRLVCLLGIGDGPGGGDPDTVELGPDVPAPRRRRLAQLLTHVRCAPEVLVVLPLRDPLTGAELATPTTISHLLRTTGQDDLTPIIHPSSAHDPGNFTARPSFDPLGLAAARALAQPPVAGSDAGRDRPTVSRRRAALRRPVTVAAATADAAGLVAFLADPARDFLRAALDVRLWESQPPLEEIPFVLDALETWQIRDRLLEAFKRGLTPDQALARERARELVPPGDVGRGVLEGPVAEVSELWLAAHGDWRAQVRDHRVLIEVGGVTIEDSLRTRGGRLVHVTVSDGRRSEIAARVEQLLLAAAGIPAPIRLHRLERDYGVRRASATTLPPPDAPSAAATLAPLVEAWRQGRSRLIPLPQDLAIAFVEQRGAGTLDRGSWQHHADDWRRSLWRRFGPAWRLFYSGVPLEVFDDPATPLDPPPPSGFDSAFAAWAAAIYGPLLGGAP